MQKVDEVVQKIYFVLLIHKFKEVRIQDVCHCFVRNAFKNCFVLIKWSLDLPCNDRGADVNNIKQAVITLLQNNCMLYML